MSKGSFRKFKNLSNNLIKEINKHNFLEAQNILNGAKQNGINIYRLLRFQIDQVDSNLFLAFADSINIDYQEILQYDRYFSIKKQLNLICTHEMLKKFSLINILENLCEKALEDINKDAFSENHIDYLNYILNNHKKYHKNLSGKINEILRLQQKNILFEKSKKEFQLYDYYKNCLNTFRLGYCNIELNENHLTFHETNDVDNIKIANIDADIPTQMYQFFQFDINSQADFIEKAKEIVFILIKNRKFYGLDNYNYNEVELEDFVNAYLIIYYESYLCLENNKLLLKKTKEEWKRTLQSYNIFEKNVEKFFDIMTASTFLDSAIDIRDTPLIFYNGFYYSIPFSNLTNDIANIVACRIKTNNNIDKKGFNFEETVRKKWKKLFKIAHIEETENNQQFECDMAFEFDNCLFVCELKNEIQPYSFDDWFRFEIKKEQNVLQAKRIANHFQNSKRLKIKLGKSADWKPKQIFTLLLYGCKYGIPTIENGVIVANETDIYNFFNKTPIGTWIINKNKQATYIQEFIKGYNYLEQTSHKLTIENFNEYIKCPMAIKFLLNNNSDINQPN